MKAVLTMLVALAMVAPAFAAGPQGAEAAIQKVWQQFSDAWGRGDAHARAALWTGDASLINPFGLKAEGRPAIEKLFEQEGAGFAKGTSHTFSDFSYHFLAPDLAAVDASGVITGIKAPDGSAAPPAKIHVFAILVERNGTWLIKLARPYVPAPLPGPPPTSAK